LTTGQEKINNSIDTAGKKLATWYQTRGIVTALVINSQFHFKVGRKLFKQNMTQDVIIDWVHYESHGQQQNV
jgi:hypothetical protein